MDSRWNALTRESVGGFPRHIAQQHVHVESLFEGLAFKHRPFEGIAKRSDGIGEHVIKHGVTLSVSGSAYARKLQWHCGSFGTGLSH